jgi:hypothetical protein
MAQFHPLHVDKRIVERNMAKGLVDRKDYAKYLAELPDRADNAEPVPFDPMRPEGAGGAGEGQ